MTKRSSKTMYCKFAWSCKNFAWLCEFNQMGKIMLEVKEDVWIDFTWTLEENVRVEIEKGNLWLLLQWHALQLKDKDNGLDISKLKLKTRY